MDMACNRGLPAKHDVWTTVMMRGRCFWY